MQREHPAGHISYTLCIIHMKSTATWWVNRPEHKVFRAGSTVQTLPANRRNVHVIKYFVIVYGSSERLTADVLFATDKNRTKILPAGVTPPHQGLSTRRGPKLTGPMLISQKKLCGDFRSVAVGDVLRHLTLRVEQHCLPLRGSLECVSITVGISLSVSASHGMRWGAENFCLSCGENREIFQQAFRFWWHAEKA